MSEKSAKANKENAKKSTGPKTAEGKAVVAGNGIRHGILSQRLFLATENPADYVALMDDLQAALRPSGALELVLVEKIATALWRQRRLVAAERATIELRSRLENTQVKQDIERAAGLDYGEFVPALLKDLDEEERERQDWCKGVIAEYHALDDEVLEANDCKRLKAEAPMMYEQLESEAEDEPVEQHIGTRMGEWAADLLVWCEGQIEKLERRPVVREVVALVQQRESAPVAYEVMARYQAALDGELYKAIKALREQQEWRLNNGIEGEAVAA